MQKSMTPVPQKNCLKNIFVKKHFSLEVKTASQFIKGMETYHNKIMEKYISKVLLALPRPTITLKALNMKL
jgi:hypothetical protein